MAEFDALAHDLLPALRHAEEQRHTRPDRQRGIGAGGRFRLDARDQLLLTVVWLRQYPTYEVLGDLFDVSDTTAGRLALRLLPLLAADGRAGMPLSAPGRRSRRGLDALLADTPSLAVVVDRFEQRVQRPRDPARADGYDSGKQRQHTLKSQLAVDERDGRIVKVATSVPGPTPDRRLLAQLGLLGRLPVGVGVLGDLGYVGVGQQHAAGATPRRKPRGRRRPAADVAYNQAFSRRRVVEHSIGRVRRYQALAQADRHHRVYHTARVVAAAGLANRQIESRLW